MRRTLDFGSVPERHSIRTVKDEIVDEDQLDALVKKVRADARKEKK